jgi:hypothetical protein
MGWRMNPGWPGTLDARAARRNEVVATIAVGGGRMAEIAHHSRGRRP